MTPAARDEHGRLLPGSLPGWGMSWWWHEQGLDPVDTAGLTPEENVRTVLRYWDAVNDGWWPAAPQNEWIGPHHPFSVDDELRLRQPTSRYTWHGRGDGCRVYSSSGAGLLTRLAAWTRRRWQLIWLRMTPSRRRST
jgi:hypothetical protein